MEGQAIDQQKRFIQYVVANNWDLRFPEFFDQLFELQDVSLATKNTAAAFSVLGASDSARTAYATFKSMQKVDVYMLGFALLEFACNVPRMDAVEEHLKMFLSRVVLPMMRLDYTRRGTLAEALTALNDILVRM
jgi:hypothetical protein